MSQFRKVLSLPMLTLAAALCASGCHQNQNQNAADSSTTTTPQDQPSDPASANLAPVSDNGAAAPAYQGSDQGYDQDAPESDYGEQPAYTASQPPPPLPDYNQPPDPGDDYLWTPGYWAWGTGGYYWVPGVWVQAPYQGALWTPGYWGYRHHHYEFFRGYWGPHIGFYGGINYGFGYVGTGYQGGYWNGGRFYYNRDVNNINTSVVHNVYARTVVGNSRDRVAFNGGSGGIQVRPRPAELAALREPHAPPMSAQLQIQHAASTNREQFASVNNGRPASATIAKPVEADRDVHPVAPPPMRNQPAVAAREQNQATPAAPGHPAMQQHAPSRPGAPEPNRPAMQQPAPSRPASHPVEPPSPSRPVPEHQVPQRPAPSAEQHSAPSRPAPQQSAPARSNEERPAPSRPAPHATEPPTPSHPVPEHTAPPKPAAAKPAPAKPAPHPEEKKPNEDHPK